ncbi:YrhB domain-containing protein [Streptomyces sioyaensis]|uniref:YrhB domain-containing protein n=1 Tax=Streptomyces sioyaensis TaxID=67364 RepID=UPI00365F1846
MLNHGEALRVAEALLQQERGPYDPELVIDYENAEIRGGLLIAPFNSPEYLESRDPQDMLLDCWPILVDLKSGKARLGTIEDRQLWQEE